MKSQAGKNKQPDLDVPAPPFEHNPSSWRHRIPIAVLAMIAFLFRLTWPSISGV